MNLSKQCPIPSLLLCLALASPSSKPRTLPTSLHMLRAWPKGALMSPSSRSIAPPGLPWPDMPMISAPSMGASCTTLVPTPTTANPALVLAPLAYPPIPACPLMPDALSLPGTLSWAALSFWRMERARRLRFATGTTFMVTLGLMAMPPKQLRLTQSFKPSSVITD